MRRMYSENQVAELIRQYAPEVKPEDIQDMFDEGEVSLAGKYVRIMDAPKSTTLTDEQITRIKKGVFINGNFLGYVNPVLFPSLLYSGENVGLIIARNTSYTEIKLYAINETTKVISIKDVANYRNIQLGSILNFNGKTIPSYPNNTGTYTLKCVDGVLTWVADE